MAAPAGSGPTRLDVVASWALPLVIGATAWAGVYPPMGDLPMHESIAALLVHHGDPSWAPPGLYVLSLAHPQQLAQLCIAAAMMVLPTALAAKLVVSLSVAATVGATARLLRHLGKGPWAAAVVAPIVLGWLYHWGFLANLAGLALFAFVTVALDRLAEAPTPRRSIEVGVLVWIAFFAHATAALSAIVTLWVLVLVRRRRVVLALSPTVVFAIALVVERHREHLAPTALAQAFASRTLWHSPLAKLRQLPAFIAGRYDWPIRLAVLAAVVAALVALAHRRVRTEHSSGQGKLVDHRFALVAGVLLALFFVTPYSINYGAFLYVRFLGPAWICLIAWLAPARPSVATRAAPAACLVAAIVALAPEIARASEHHRMLSSLYPRIAQGSAVAVVTYGKAPRSAFNPATAGQRVLAERGGRALFSFAEYPTSPVTIPPEKRWDALAVRVYGQPGDLVPQTDLDAIRYVLAWVPDAGLWPLLEAGFFPDARLVARSGEWLLFESTHAVRPIDAPLPPERANAETIQSRVHAAVRSRAAAPSATPPSASERIAEPAP